jgi:hypothetical protein
MCATIFNILAEILSKPVLLKFVNVSELVERFQLRRYQN